MEFIGVSYRYKGEPADALSGLSLSVPPGRAVALLGPNGSGKSTALGIAAGWLAAGSGRVERAGGAAFLPQSERLAFSFTCLEYVSFGRAPHLPYLSVPSGRDEEKAAAALDEVGMGAKARKRITAISGGELQLVRIARALAQEAAYVILDEPTDMLDPAHVASIGAAVRRLAASGAGVLFSTHDLAFALACADEAALLRAGRLVGSGPASRVIDCASLSRLYGTPFVLKELPVPLHG
ncbi:MAG: ABC transporter ATP-binding protein [Spirochaetes bacterium]|nr:ABC transporter ATP-binding protein [Spirochaetota bacterium]